MDDLISRTVYHPAIAQPVISLTEIMSRVDWSIGAAIGMLAGTWFIRVLRSIQRDLGYSDHILSLAGTRPIISCFGNNQFWPEVFFSIAALPTITSRSFIAKPARG
jgi:hypothetical protein